MPNDLPVVPVEDDEVLTQFGVYFDGETEFYDAPRRTGMKAMSLIRGRLERTDAGEIVRQVRRPEEDAARYTTAWDLRAMGFVVEHTPNRRNPDHVSAHFEAGWTEDVAVCFVSCFGVDDMDLPAEEDLPDPWAGDHPAYPDEG